MNEEAQRELRESGVRAADAIRGFMSAAERSAAKAHGISGVGVSAVPGMQYSIRAAQRAEMAKVEAAAWCYQLGGLDPQKVANMTFAEFAEMCVKNIGMPEPPDIPRRVLAGLRYIGKKVE